MEINKYFVATLRSIHDLNTLDFFAGKGKLSQTEFRLIMEVILEQEKGKDIISSELARRLGITRSAVSQIVTRLENKNVIQRVDSPIDRKIAYIRLSDSTVSAFNEQCGQLNEFVDKLVDKLGSDRIDNLFKEFDSFMDACKEVRTEMEEEDVIAQA